MHGLEALRQKNNRGVERNAEKETASSILVSSERRISIQSTGKDRKFNVQQEKRHGRPGQKLYWENRVLLTAARDPHLPCCEEDEYDDASHESADDNAAGPFEACAAFLQGEEQWDEPTDRENTADCVEFAKALPVGH